MNREKLSKIQFLREWGNIDVSCKLRDWKEGEFETWVKNNENRKRNQS